MRESACPAWALGLAEGRKISELEGTPQMHGSARRPKIVVSGGGSGVVSHAGSRLLAELADRAGVTGLFSDVLAGFRERRSGHDPGRVLVDLAVMLADGGTTISDLAVLRNQPDLFGPVASTATAWRVLDRVDDKLLAGLRQARATARERIWLQAADTSRLPLTTMAVGRVWPGIGGPADGAGATKPWLAHLRRTREVKGLDLRFSVGFAMTAPVQAAILALPKQAWTAAIEAAGELRDGADVAELTGWLGDHTAAGWPEGMRIIVRRERPHPGAQLTFSDADGWRFQTFATDTGVGQLAQLEARHRAHARVEDRIRCAKSTGLAHLPSRQLNVNTVWVELVGLACDLLAWTRLLLLDGALATAEPKQLRYRLLHVAARLVRSGRRLHLRIDRN